MCEIIDHKTDGSTVHTDDTILTDKDGRATHRHTTKGWWLCVKYRDESTSWVRLKDVKDSNPLELAEYAVANKLVHEPAFNWRVPYTIRRRDRMIMKVKTRYIKRTQKYGISLPRTLKDAYQLDLDNGNSL